MVQLEDLQNCTKLSSFCTACKLNEIHRFLWHLLVFCSVKQEMKLEQETYLGYASLYLIDILYINTSITLSRFFESGKRNKRLDTKV
ncbi:hypothetical protein BH23THE1_BH23THE1_35290 [soil metagenome]